MISPARAAALKSLQEFRRWGQVTPARCDRQDDSRLAEKICYGVLQNERFLDYCLNHFLSSDISRLHPRVHDVLRLSAFQILFLDRVPVSACVNDAVSLCRGGKTAYACGMVNAVLRRLSEQKEALLALDLPLGIRYSHPDWLVQALRHKYDRDFVEAFLMANQESAPLRLQIDQNKIGLEAYLQLLSDRRIFPLSVNRSFSSVLIPSEQVDLLPGYQEGLFYVQDDAARASVVIAKIQPGMKVLDACAAPGGKSMAAMLTGADVIACDISEKRLSKCTSNFQRMKFDIKTQQKDASQFDPSFSCLFDVVIADVPCSGTGVIRRHPEIRKKEIDDLHHLIDQQRKILCNLAEYVKPGGTLIYSTCSVLREEDEAQVQWFLDHHDGFKQIPVSVDGFSCENGMLRSWPQYNQNDGFFAAKLIKNS